MALTTAGQKEIPHFDHISTKEGLSGEVITALCQDRRGFLWVGTNGQGLNRYDGNEVKIWRHSKRDSFSLCSDLVWSIVEDANGLIWVGTQNGVSRLNPYSSRCDNYLDEGEPITASYLFRDQMGFIWSASVFSLSRFNPDANRFERYLAVDGSAISFVRSAAGTDGRFWLGGSKGVTAFNPLTGSTQFLFPFPNEPSNAEKNRTHIKIDPYGNIWVFCWGGGLQRFHPETGRFERFIWDKKPKFPGSANIPFDVEETFDGEGKRILWICAEHGTFRFPLEAHAFPSMDKPHTLLRPGSEVDTAGWQTWRLMTDHHGNLWFGTIHGLYRYKKEQEYIQVVQTPGKSVIDQVFFTQNGEALVTSQFHTPLMILDARQHWKKVFQNLPPGSKDGAGEICMSAAKDEEDGILYAATFHGLVAYDEKSGETRWFRWNPKDSNCIADPKVTRVLPLGNGQLLLSFWRNGLQIFDTRRRKGVWRFQDEGKNAWCLKRIDSVIWVGTEWALYTFDPQKRTMTEMTPPEERGAPLRYYDVIKDRHERIWVGTNYGFCLLDIQNHRVLEKYTSEDGLAGTEVTSMAEDSLGRLWLGTPEGFRLFNPKTRRFYKLDKAVFPPGGIWRAPDEKLWLTNGGQILIFNPALFRVPRPSRVYITGLKINEHDTLPDIAFEQISQIRLQPGQNALTFSFTAIDLDVFGKTNFRYILEGLQ
ncbi:MAG TPA: two-component regulator propeller domain-containing protein, partial [Saprospiraceae bacterium]|nr:two-component regulator propeller domain-containing protein [Saprospiraceae bacterium]